MRVCRDLPAGFVGIGLEKSVDVAVRDTHPASMPHFYIAKASSQPALVTSWTECDQL